MSKTLQTDLYREPKEGEIVRLQLNNGLTVVMMKSSASPVVAVDLWYKVGSKNEEPGKSGFAHLFEHMMFQGSENVGKAEHMQLVSDVGGWMNGSTGKDRTNYFEVVPANQLRLALWLEADRMRSLAVTVENFENQRDTVKEERLLRVDNAPYAPVFHELLDELAYENWAYKHSVIGSMADLDNARFEDVKNFHDTYYTPNNAVLAIVGDFQAKEAWKMVREYFEAIPAGQFPSPVDLTEPIRNGEKRLTWEDKFAPLPAFTCAYLTPPHGHKETYALEIVDKLLFDGESSRLFRRFIEKDQSLLHIFGGMDPKMGPGLFFFFGQIKPGQDMAAIQSAFQEEIEKLQNEQVGEKELQKIKNQLKADFVSKLAQVYYKADLLCFYTTCFDDPNLLYKEIDAYLQITSEDIRQAAQKYLTINNRSIIEIYPSAAQKGRAV